MLYKESDPINQLVKVVVPFFSFFSTEILILKTRGIPKDGP